MIGANGSAGTNGTNGLNGKTVLNDNVDPIATVGVNGDFFINTTSNKIFGPKTAGVWPATGTSLVGPAGSFSITGTVGQTIYHNGTDWKATSNLYNDGITVGIGTAAVPANMVLIKAASGIGSIPFAIQNFANTNSLVEIGNANGDGIIRGFNNGTSSFQLSASTSLDSYVQTNFGIGMTGSVPQKLTVNGNVLLMDGNALMFREKIADGINFTSFRAQAQTSDIVYTLPATIGVLGDVLTTNSTGVLSWTTPSLGNWSLSGNSVSTIKKFGTVDNFDLPFITNGMEQMRITNTGKIGIGTPTPTFQLSLNGAATDANIHLFNTTSGSSGADGLRINFSGINTNIFNYEAGNMNFGTSGSDRLIIKANGAVQIPNLVGPGVVQTDNVGNLSMVSILGTKDYISKWSSTGSSLGDSRIFDDGNYVGIGRKIPVFSDGYFDIELPIVGNTYGGMYLNSKSATGKPFYGYSLNNTVVAWNYLDGTTSDWKINNGAADRLIVKKTGVVQIPDLAGAGSVLTDASGNLSVNKCAFSAFASASQKFTNSFDVILYNKIEFDFNSDFSAGVFTAPADGVYHFDATFTYAAGGSPAASLFFNIFINDNRYATSRQPVVNNINTVDISMTINLTKGDKVDARMFTNSGALDTHISSSYHNHFSGYRIF